MSTWLIENRTTPREALTAETRADLLRAIGEALRELATSEEAVNERLEHEQFLALSDARKGLALAYARAGGEPLEGICAMWGRTLTPQEGPASTICAHCGRSYGPDSDDE